MPDRSDGDADGEDPPGRLGRTLSRFQPLAPDWFIRVVTPKPAPVPQACSIDNPDCEACQ